MFLYLVAFACGFAMDIVWAKTVSAVAGKRPLLAANLSVILYVFTAVTTLLIVQQCFGACLAYAVGNWCGTYLTVRWST
jgi:hypothetical protein